MVERWKEIEEYPGYEISDKGRVRSYYEKKKKVGTWGGYDRILHDEPQRILKQSDDGNGYMKVYLQNDEKRTCVKVHKLVADAFVPNPNGYDTVDHIKSGPEGKLDNRAENLRWLPRRDNIQKAYADGMCDNRIRMSKKPIMVTDEWTGEEKYYDSINRVADELCLDQSTVSKAIKNDGLMKKRYRADYADREDRLLYASMYDYDPEYDC